MSRFQGLLATACNLRHYTMGRLVGAGGGGGAASRDAIGRAAALLGKIGTRGETLVCGGGFDASQRAVEPTVAWGPCTCMSSQLSQLDLSTLSTLSTLRTCLQGYTTH